MQLCVETQVEKEVPRKIRDMRYMDLTFHIVHKRTMQLHRQTILNKHNTLFSETAIF